MRGSGADSRKTLIAEEQDRPDVAKKRFEWRDSQGLIDPARVVFINETRAKLLLVADGVGGNPAGDQASRLTVQGIVQYLLNTVHWLFRLNDGRDDAFLED